MTFPAPEASADLFELIRQYLADLLGLPIHRQGTPVLGEQYWSWDGGICFRVLLEGSASIEQLQQHAESGPLQLVVADYLAPSRRQQLRARGVGYADAAGNAWLAYPHPRLYVLVEGRARPKPAAPPVRGTVRATQMRFLFQVLTGGPLPTYTPAALAAHTGISVRLVQQFLEDLERQGLWRLTAEGQPATLDLLAHTWQQRYGATLRNRLNPQSYRWRDPAQANGPDQPPALPAHTWWSGQAAAGLLLDQPVHPNSYTLYTRQNRASLAAHLGLVPHEHGNVEILNAFFSDAPDHIAERHCAPPLLVHTDLLLNDTSRDVALSQQVQKKFLLLPPPPGSRAAA